MEKDFNNWNDLKQKIDQSEKKLVFKERDVWWCSVGINVGHEENGKNEFFTRPVLVVRKFNRQLFLGVPLTTKCKESRYYHKILFKEKEQCAMISQIRVFESKRMRKKMGELPGNQLDMIKRAIADMVLFGGK